MADDVAGAVRRTPRPTPRADDHQTPETGAPVAPGATNPASPVSPDAGPATGDLRVYEVTLTRDIPVTGGRVLFAGPECDMEAYAALPPCMACGGGGQDDHGTVFEASLAVHFAGPPVKAERRVRQLCMWCGHVLIDVALTRDTEPPEWPVGALVRVEDGLATVVPHDPGAELPPGCCALPDDEPADDGLCSKCAAPRTAFDPFGDGLCKQHLAEAYAAENDAERLADEEHDLAAEDATYPEPEPGIPVDNPTTEDTDDWPAEPVEVDRG